MNKKIGYGGNASDVSNDQSMVVLTILEKTNETLLSNSERMVTVLKIMSNYQKARVKITNRQLNKLKFAAKHKTGTY